MPGHTGVLCGSVAVPELRAAVRVHETQDKRGKTAAEQEMLPVYLLKGREHGRCLRHKKRPLTVAAASGLGVHE